MLFNRRSAGPNKTSTTMEALEPDDVDASDRSELLLLLKVIMTYQLKIGLGELA
jgi:hypothetical protein